MARYYRKKGPGFRGRFSRRRKSYGYSKSRSRYKTRRSRRPTVSRGGLRL